MVKHQHGLPLLASTLHALLVHLRLTRAKISRASQGACVPPYAGHIVCLILWCTMVVHAVCSRFSTFSGNQKLACMELTHIHSTKMQHCNIVGSWCKDVLNVTPGLPE
jgi:hypothetical protein